MKRQQAPTLFADLPSEEEPLFAPAPEVDHDYTEADCFTGRDAMGYQCTLDGKPARVKDGGPTFARIEPVDLEQEEAYVPWENVEVAGIDENGDACDYRFFTTHSA